MRVLHLLTSGGMGGIECLCKDIANYSTDDNYFAFVFDGGILCDEMRNSNANVFELKSMKFSFSTLSRLVSLCEANQIDIIQVHHRDMFLYWFALKISKRYKRAKIITTIHSCYEKGFYYPPNRIITIGLMNYFVRKMMNKSDALISVSQAGFRSFYDFDRKIIDKKKKYVVYNGISTDLLNQGKYINRKKNKKINLLYAGRLEDFKGIGILIEAISILRDTLDIHLTIAGSGSKTDYYLNCISRLHCSDLIEYVGVVREDKLKDLRIKNDFFIYPSTWQEIFGISIVEAMAFGMVPIVNAVGGIPEIVDTQCAVINEKISTEGIVETLKTVSKISEEKFYYLSENARKRAVDFSIEKTVSMLSGVYKDI